MSAFPIDRFPVLTEGAERRKFPALPRSIPWSAIEPHRERAEANHSQTLEVLASRGGMGAGELWCAVTGKSLREHPPEEEAFEWLTDWARRIELATPDPAPLTRARLDGMGCEVPGCQHVHHGSGRMFFHARCHLDAGTRSSYDPTTGVLRIACRVCERVVVTLLVAP